ncbi:MAG: lysophospholipid acyltransferase family protein [Thermodesulfobacteriota bacterium]|jgi:KDO2-lipid IV(A) lauroyltransferase|nr:MAG: lysophospholipid acyltransferase family protein [Thermodesulfobacteriota bacterium]
MAQKRSRPKVYTVGLKDYIAYFFERLFLACFIFFTRFIPITYLYPAAARIGKIGAVLSPAYKQRILGNLNLAFGKEKKTREKLALYREATINTIKNYFEMLAVINALNKRYLNSAIQIEGRENLEASLKKGKGVIAVGGHLGSFTLVGIKLQEQGFPFHTVGRGITDPLRRNVYEKYRREQGQPFIYTRTSREAFNITLQVLKQNEIIFLITDENRRFGGVFVDFFNRPASTTPGPALLHLRTGADIIPIILLRNPDNTHKLIIEPPLSFSYKGNHEEDVKEITQVITQKIEEYIRKYPTQWMWTNRRWRTRPSEEKAKGKTDPAYRRY